MEIIYTAINRRESAAGGGGARSKWEMKKGNNLDNEFMFILKKVIFSVL